ncbi:hypothetical protein RB653_002823 [Dictyostelium firmibasis]|uniref:Chromo domain-containing protein n=1 Tax=Dictyostelium firmibasis TaxID=79012 RepID=A0AAN7U3J8_9MYCE
MSESKAKQLSGFTLPEGIKDINDLISKYSAFKDKEIKNEERKKELSNLREELVRVKTTADIHEREKKEKEEKNNLLLKEIFENQGLKKDLENLELKIKEEREEKKKEIENLSKTIKILNEKLEHSVKNIIVKKESEQAEIPFSPAQQHQNNEDVEVGSSASTSKNIKFDKINPREFNGLIDIFISKGPEEFLTKIQWIFKKSRFILEDIDHCEFMVEYIFHQVFSNTEEKRDICLNYRLIVSRYLANNKGRISWDGFKSIIINNDDKTARKLLIKNQLKVHSANNYVNEEGNGLEAHISIFEMSSLYIDSLSPDERFIHFLLPFPKIIIMAKRCNKIFKNRTIKEQLQKMANGRKNWDEAIKSIEFAINTAPSSTTKLSPSRIVYGFDPRVPLNINSSYNINFAEATSHFTHVAQDNMVDSQIEQAIQYNKDREDIDYEEGDLILIKRSKLNTFKIDIGDEFKLLPNYCGPFKIVKRLSSLNYQIRLVNRKNGLRKIHVDDIKPYIEEDRILFTKRDVEKHSQLKDDIESIIDKRCRKYRNNNSRIEYKVRYKFSNEDHDEWVPLHYIENCQELIKKFEEELIKSGVPLENNFKKKSQNII